MCKAYQVSEYNVEGLTLLDQWLNEQQLVSLRRSDKFRNSVALLTYHSNCGCSFTIQIHRFLQKLLKENTVSYTLREQAHRSVAAFLQKVIVDKEVFAYAMTTNTAILSHLGRHDWQELDKKDAEKLLMHVLDFSEPELEILASGNRNMLTSTQVGRALKTMPRFAVTYELN